MPRIKTWKKKKSSILNLHLGRIKKNGESGHNIKDCEFCKKYGKVPNKKGKDRSSEQTGVSHHAGSSKTATNNASETVSNSGDKSQDGNHSNIKKSDNHEDKTNSQTKTLVCSICGKCYNEKEERLFKHHTMFAHRKMYKCNVCRTSYDSERLLKIHMRTTHPVHIVHKKEYKCRVCTESFRNVKDLIHHVKKYHRVNRRSLRSFQCNKCFMSFDSKQLLRGHLYHDHYKCESNSVNLKCKHCDKEYSSYKQYSHHLSEKHRKRVDLSLFIGNKSSKEETKERNKVIQPKKKKVPTATLR